MLFDASENAYYVLPGSFAYCVQRVDATSGQVTWETTTEESFTFSPFGFFPLNTQDVLYFGSDSQLLAVDKSTGEMKTLLNNEDYEFLPLVVEGDRLYVRARRTRGTERFELWGVDLVKGEQAWQLELGKARPVDPPNEMSGIVDQADYGWTWRSRPGGLLWLEFQAEPNQIVLKNIASDGSASGEQTITLKLGDTDYYTIPDIIGWQGQIVYFVLDAGIYALDTSTGELLFHY
jgi:outer membrane protein assembly factor BamB